MLVQSSMSTPLALGGDNNPNVDDSDYALKVLLSLSSRYHLLVVVIVLCLTSTVAQRTLQGLNDCKHEQEEVK